MNVLTKADYKDLSQLLYLASRFGYIDMIRYLLDKYKTIEVNEKVVRSAVLSGNLDIVKILLKENMSIEIYSEALQTACSTGNEDIVRYLFENKYIPPYMSYHIGVCFNYACSHGNPKIVEHFMEPGVIIRDKNIDRLFINICKNGHLDVINVIMNAPIVKKFMNSERMKFLLLEIVALGVGMLVIRHVVQNNYFQVVDTLTIADFKCFDDKHLYANYIRSVLSDRGKQKKRDIILGLIDRAMSDGKADIVAKLVERL